MGDQPAAAAAPRGGRHSRVDVGVRTDERRLLPSRRGVRKGHGVPPAHRVRDRGATAGCRHGRAPCVTSSSPTIASTDGVTASRAMEGSGSTGIVPRGCGTASQRSRARPRSAIDGTVADRPDAMLASASEVREVVCLDLECVFDAVDRVRDGDRVRWDDTDVAQALCHRAQRSA